MIPVQFRSRRQVLGDFRNDVARALPMTLRLKLPVDATATVSSNGILEVQWFGEITRELVTELQQWAQTPSLPRVLYDEHRAVVEQAKAINERVLAILKYGLNQAYLERALGYIEPAWLQWRQFPETEFRPFPMPVRAVVLDAEVASSSRFDAEAAAQSLLDRDFVPFAAMVHLHRARVEHVDARAKWIDATIAAELAVKEFLLRKEPKLGPLLLEVPAPPIAKLYGRILEEYSGQASPLRKELIAGAERRNELIHRPGTPDPDIEEAALYVQDVQKAILHLVSSLADEDWVSTHNFRAASVKLTITEGNPGLEKARGD